MFSKPHSGLDGSPRQQTHKRASGFTLLEVVVAIALTAFVLLILLVGIRLGASALQNGDRNLAKLDRSTAIVQVIRRQVAAAIPRVIQVKEQQGPRPYLCFQGDSHELRFLTGASLVADRSYGLWLATYRVIETSDGQQQLLASEAPALDTPELHDALLSTLAPVGPVESLGDPAQRIALSYLQPPALDKPSVWVSEWNPDQKELPLGIRIDVWREGYAGALTFAIPVQTAETQ